MRWSRGRDSASTGTIFLNAFEQFAEFDFGFPNADAYSLHDEASDIVVTMTTLDFSRSAVCCQACYQKSKPLFPETEIKIGDQDRYFEKTTIFPVETRIPILILLFDIKLNRVLYFERLKGR